MSLNNDNYAENGHSNFDMSLIEKQDAVIGAKRSKNRKSIEDIKLEAALRLELGEDGLTSQELHDIFI